MQSCPLVRPAPGHECKEVPVDGQCCGEIKCHPAGCMVDGKEYKNEAAIPKDDPCTMCVCSMGQVQCVMEACAPVEPKPGQECKEVKVEGQCCPDYDCKMVGCTEDDGKTYKNGDEIPQDSPCEHCRCVEGEKLCAIHDCPELLPEPGQNCEIVEVEGQCCGEVKCTPAGKIWFSNSHFFHDKIVVFTPMAFCLEGMGIAQRFPKNFSHFPS